MTGLRHRKKEQARDALVDAAIRLFEERGIDATSADDIAHAVEMSRGTFFNYFPYKEAILVEIGARLVAGIAAETGGRRRRSPRRALYDVADAVATVVDRYPHVAPYVAREMTHPDPVRRAYALERMQYPRLYEDLLQQLRRDGQLRARRLDVYGRQLVDLTTGALVRAGQDFPLADLRAQLRANVDLFWDGAIVAPRDAGPHR